MFYCIPKSFFESNNFLYLAIIYVLWEDPFGTSGWHICINEVYVRPI